MSTGTGKLGGRVALVTGSGSGIGRAIAARFLDEGAQVALVEHDLAAGEDAREELSARGAVLLQQVDVADEPAVRDSVAEVVRWGGRLDCVVNNAGYFGAFGTPGDEAGFMTGQVLTLDGGMTRKMTYVE